jgi:ribose-phosphate pyrophosphokinase
MVRENGAKSIRVAATHGVFAPPAVDRLNNSSIDEVVVADTVPLSEESKKIRNLKVLTVAELLGEAIHRIHNDESVSEIFKKQ